MNLEAVSSNENHHIDTKKRKGTRAMHPQNKYAENPPNFTFLASKYPSFREHVTYTSNGKSRIDWTDFNATRELTRVLLKHDYGIEWWIPDRQLCPTVPNRANYIHWVEDLLNSCPAPWHKCADIKIWGLDIGTGANCIYPLLGAAIHGWHFVGTDVTDIAISWAQRNVQHNPHLTDLIEIRSVKDSRWGADEYPIISAAYSDHNQLSKPTCSVQCEVPGMPIVHTEGTEDKMTPIEGGCIPDDAPTKAAMVPPQPTKAEDVEQLNMKKGSLNDALQSQVNSPEVFNSRCNGPPILSGVVREREKFDFCMCNPPFFESIEEAGANPHTSCGGTSEEMVYPGGEEGFISRIIEDSVLLKKQFHWFTTMVGRKVNLKVLIPKLWKKGVSMLRTTEFTQGRTSRWGLAWSFSPSKHCLSSPRMTGDSRYMSFVLQGLPRNCRAYDILQALVQHMQEFGAACRVDMQTFSFVGTLPAHLVKSCGPMSPSQKRQREVLELDERPLQSVIDLQFHVSVFEQGPGALLIKGSLLDNRSSLAGILSTMLNSAEQSLKEQFHVELRQR